MGSSVLITGVSGQDGRLLIRRLTEQADRIVGVVPPDAPADQVNELEADNVSVVRAELSDIAVCRQLISDIRPDTVFHFAAISSVGKSWELPVETSQLNGMASVALMAQCLELTEKYRRTVKFVNCSSAEIFGSTTQFPQNEDTPLEPNSPYGVSKAFAHLMADAFRSRGLWVSNAILYNHESVLRPETFVTRKITKTVAAIATGVEDVLRLGNLDARRDWGWAPDYVDCLVRMARQDTSDNFIIATGESHSVRDFVATAFAAAGIDDWEPLVEVESGLIRPADAADLVGDASKARRVLDWRPTVGFQQIVENMVSADLRLAAAAAN